MAENQGEETETVDRFFDSTLESVDSAEEIAVMAAEEAGFEEEDLQKIGNGGAGVHGERRGARQPLQCQQEGPVSIRKGPERLTVKIADEGEGFDYEHLPDPLAPENLLRNSGRGIFLIRAFMDEFEVRRRAAGGHGSDFSEIPGR